MANLSAEVLNVRFNGGGPMAVVNKCAVCPFRGDRTPCKPKAITPEVSVLKLRIDTTGRFYFRPIDEAVKTCSQCAKNLNTCICSGKKIN